MDLQLKEKIIIVTGGARGIGAAIALACGDEGAIPVIVDRSADAADQVQSQIHRKGAISHFIQTELADPANCKRAVDETVRTFGRVDGLVNNAGRNDGVGLERGDPGRFMDSIKDNLLHYYAMAHYSLPYLKRTRGPIVNIGSKVAATGQGNTSGYAASKGGVLGLTREWAAELLSYNIRVNCVVPAEVLTPLYESWLKTFPDPEEKLRAILARIPLEKRMTKPAEIAATTVFLLSAQSGHTTGQELCVDGGYVHLDRALT
ncbi:MAG TPA: SDR family oxidoreductase [Candidatus Acidoferrales bacterium]|nr:SDR family oxidoreductase [Candidatus Acidoferrales bacterium]